MAAFRVGQRVRIVQCENLPHLLGMCATVTQELHPFTSAADLTRCEGYGIDIDGVGDRGACGTVFAAAPHQLEPLQPEGAQPAKWEDCMWQPSAELLAECAA